MNGAASTAVRTSSFQGPRSRPLERRRGQWGMWLFIGTEAMLFALLFFSYVYLGVSRPEWPPGEDPSIALAVIMAIVLIMSSIALFWGERAIKRGARQRLIFAVALTLALAAAFIVLHGVEYSNLLKSGVAPNRSAYGSVFFTIVSFHLAHLILGVLMLLYILARTSAGHFTERRHLAVRNVSLYWHFVDVVWMVIVTLLYFSPRLYG